MIRLTRALISNKKSGFFFNKEEINPCVLNAQYAVRG
jgi:alanine transaminase